MNHLTQTNMTGGGGFVAVPVTIDIAFCA